MSPRQGDATDPTLPPYIRRLLRAMEVAAPAGDVRLVNVRHDAWCNLLARRGPCNCEPDVELGPDLARGDS